MGASRAAGRRLLNFLSSATANGPREALRTLNLQSLAGRPIEEVFIGLMEYVCENQDGGTLDEGIAREAFIETITDLAENGITDLDALTPEQMQTIFELYAAHAIEVRLCNDIGTKAIVLPSDPAAAATVQTQLLDFIGRSRESSGPHPCASAKHCHPRLRAGLQHPSDDGRGRGGGLMKRHVIIGRFGASDRVAVPTAEGEAATRVEFVAARRRLDYGIGQALDDLARRQVFPSLSCF